MKRLTVLLVLLGLHAANNLFAQTSQTSGSTEPLRTTFIDSVKEIAAIAPQIPPAGSATLLRSELTATEYQSIIDFSVALKMHNFAELQARIGRGENVPFDEMAAKYFPTTADYQLVAEWLAAQGFTVKPGDVYNLSVFASGSIAAIEHAFGTKFGRVQFAGSEFTSALAAPSLPATVAQPVLSINGLQPHLRPRLHSRFAPAEAEKLINNQPPYTVPEIAKAYKAAGLNANGSGQTIGIVIDTFPADSDLIQFWNDNGINQSLDDIEKIRAVSGTLPSPSGEETLDVEWSSVMAPESPYEFMRQPIWRSLTSTKHTKQSLTT
jgi:kumamolisin